MKRFLGLLVALVLALFAQRWLNEGGLILQDSLLLFAVAAVLFVACAAPPQPWPDLQPRRRWPAQGKALAGAGLLLAIVATGLFWQDLHSPWGLGLWLLAIPLFAAGLWLEGSPNPEGQGEPAPSHDPAGASPARLRRAGDWLAPHRWELGLLLVIVAVAAFARFCQLDAIPNGCQSDECNNGLDALKWLEGTPYTVYAETNEGQATLFTYLLALSFKLLGVGVVQMRLVSAAAGVLTVIAVYLLARDLFSIPVALAAAALLAGSRWHITFSRIVYELILMPLAEVLLFLFLLRALRWGRRRDWALAGIVLGGGMHTYTAWRVMPILIVCFLLYWLIGHWRRWRRDLEGVLALVGGAFVGLVPLGVYMVQKWNVFQSRTEHISVLQDIERAQSLEPLWSNLRKTLLMFNYQGDFAALNNLPGAPLLPFDVQSPGSVMSHVPGAWLLASAVGALFVLGVAYALRHANHPVSILLLAGLIVVGSVAVLSVAHEAPTARRPIGLAPIVILLAAMALDQTLTTFRLVWRGQAQRAASAVLAVAVAGVALGGVDTYLNVQAKNESVYIAYSGVEAAVGRYVAALPAGARIYLVSAFQHHSAVRLIGGRRETRLLNLAQDLPLQGDPGSDVVYIVEAVDQRLETLFTQYYPGGELIEHRDPFGRVYFISYRLTREQVVATHGLAATYYRGDRWDAGPAVLERRDGPLAFDWQQAPPTEVPFSAQWRGSLLVPAFGTYRFAVEPAPAGDVSLVVGGQTVLDTAAATASGEIRLVAGFHEVTLRFRTTRAPGAWSVTWEGPGVRRGPMPQDVLYTIRAPANGLVGYYFRSIDWSGTPALIEKDVLILANDALGDRFSILWKGKVAAPASGLYTFGTRSDDGSYVTVDGRMVVDNGGGHGASYREGSTQLTKGFHDIEVRYFQDGGSRDMQLWWATPGGPKEMIPSEYLFPLEASEIPADLVLPPAPVAKPTPLPSGPGGAPTPPPAAGPIPSGPPAPAPAVSAELAWQAGSCGSGSGEFQSPRGVAADAKGNVYVADAGNHRVVKFGADGKMLLTFGREGTGDGELTEPFDLVVEADGNLVVLDSVGQALQRFAADGRFLARFGGDLALYRPRGIGLDPSGDLLVADTGKLRVLRLSPGGGVIQQYGGPGQQVGAKQPVDVAAGPSGFLYMTEAESGLIWRLGPAAETARWSAVTPASTLDGPHVAVGPDGAIYVTDPERWRVAIYDSGGAALGQFGSQGSGPGQFLKPVGLAVDQAGLVYVVDSHACRVQAFGLASARSK